MSSTETISAEPEQSVRPRVVFTLLVLLGINFMNFYDRQVLAGVQEAVKAEWSLSDSDLGDLGTAFIILYAVVGVPLGRLADTWSRKWILFIGVGVWSLMTAGSGLAQTFAALYVLRLGVGIGEASCAPAAGSLIGDLFPPERRARAMSIFMLGLPLGLGLSFIVSGAVAKYYGWKEAFFVAGAPGLVLTVCCLFIYEPARGSADRIHGVDFAPVRLPFLVVVQRLLALPTMWWIIASGAFHNFNMYALGHFLASFVKRYHGVDIGTAGQISGLVYGFGAVGMFAAGWLGDRAFRHRINGRLQVAWIALAIALPFLCAAFSTGPNQPMLFAFLLLPACLGLYAYYGTVYTAIHDIIEPELRGMAMAVYFCAMYLFGGLAGPTVTGRLSDYFARRAALADTIDPSWASAIGLHHAMFALIPTLDFLLVLVLFAASRTVTADYHKLQKRQETRGGIAG